MEVIFTIFDRRTYTTTYYKRKGDEDAEKITHDEYFKLYDHNKHKVLPGLTIE